MEDQVLYGKNPIIEMDENFILSKDEELKISLKIRKDDSSKAQDAIDFIEEYLLLNSDLTALQVLKKMAAGLSHA
ncbi:hypothetical protein FACS189415_4570 [Bacteroidia bacterium]|nr:hypothetical protein FACS189415_4570 [Bacteroidia bacterium]